MFKIFEVIDKAALWISVTALLFITIMTCISVLGRYFFAAPIPDDLVMSEFTMVIVAFLPLAAVQAAREHVFVTIFSDWLTILLKLGQKVNCWLSKNKKHD